MKKYFLYLLGLVLIPFVLLSTVDNTVAYTPYSFKWTTNSLNYEVNTSSISGLNVNDTLSDISSAAQAWTTQTNANWKFNYLGTTTRTGFNNDGHQVVFFTQDTNAMSGDTYLAFTGCWWNGSVTLDCDIKIREGAYEWYTSNQLCTPTTFGAFVLDLMTHEFGHMLGLDHSTVDDATMHIGVYSCDMRDRTLEADDIAGILFLWGAIPSPSPSPVPGPTPTPTPIPNPPPPPPPTGATLTVRAYKQRGLQKADLSWQGLTGSTVDVYRNNQKILAGTTNDGFQTDAINRRGGAGYTYLVCELNTVATCTNTANANF